MNALPAPPLDPLPLLPTWTLSLLSWLLALAALLLLLGVFARRFRPPTPAGSPAASRSPMALADDPLDWSERLAALARRTHRHEAYREGSHALAGLVRDRLAEITPLPARRMTVSELVSRLEKGSLTRLLQEIRGLRYRREPPRRREFDRLCQLADRSVRPEHASLRPEDPE